MFIANALPHFIHGISGNKFPTPFSKPPGKGLSSPTVNVLWALLNLVIGYLFYWTGKISTGNIWTLIIFFIGFAFISIFSSKAFANKMTQ
jgi:Zn-dependent protease with chaperone function